MFSDFRYPQNGGNDYALRDACEPIMMILATAAAVAAQKTPPGEKTPWQWRAENHQNFAQKVPNVTS